MKTCTPATMIVALLSLAAAPAARAQGLVQPELKIGAWTVLELLQQGNVTMWALLGCSVLTVSFILERLIVLRKSRVMPPKFVDRLMDRLRDDTLDPEKALELCRQNGSPTAQILGVVARYWGRPASEIRRAVAHRADVVVYPLRRRVRAIGGMATLGPLLGLFGTVIGMIQAFHSLAPGETERLAEGISLALVATASGLAVAIVAAAAYYWLLGRVDRLIQEMDLLADEVIEYVAAEATEPDTGKTRPRVLATAKRASG